MIELRKVDERRSFHYGVDGPLEGTGITDQFIAIVFGWAYGIWEGK